jgi:hypothetical protein
MANFTPTSGVDWTQNHCFAIGAEVEFTSTDRSAEWLTPIPFSIGGLQIFGGNLNYNIHGADGASVALFRIAIIGDTNGGDGGAGPGSVLLINKAIYVFHGENGESEIMPFSVQLNNRRLPVPTDGSAYQFVMNVNAAGAIWPAHVEIELAGMWWDTSEAPPVGI